MGKHGGKCVDGKVEGVCVRGHSCTPCVTGIEVRECTHQSVFAFRHEHRGEHSRSLLCTGKGDFIAKLHIALKECSETEYWLELLTESGYYSDRDMLDRCIEVKRILISSINTAKENAK